MILMNTSLREQLQKLNFGVGLVMNPQALLAFCSLAFAGL